MTDEHTPPPAPASAPEPAPAYGAPAHAAPSNEGQGLGVASLVLGILGVLTAWIPIIGLVAWIFAPLGLIFGFISLGKPAAKGLAIGGLITSGIALAICILWIVGLGALVNQAQRDGLLDEIPAATAPATTPADPSATESTSADAASSADATADTGPGADSADAGAASGHAQTPTPPSN